MKIKLVANHRMRQAEAEANRLQEDNLRKMKRARSSSARGRAPRPDTTPHVASALDQSIALGMSTRNYRSQSPNPMLRTSIQLGPSSVLESSSYRLVLLINSFLCHFNRCIIS